MAMNQGVQCSLQGVDFQLSLDTKGGTDIQRRAFRGKLVLQPQTMLGSGEWQRWAIDLWLVLIRRRRPRIRGRRQVGP